jgi:hypothetical protein
MSHRIAPPNSGTDVCNRSHFPAWHPSGLEANSAYCSKWPWPVALDHSLRRRVESVPCEPLRPDCGGEVKALPVSVLEPGSIRRMPLSWPWT